ncbi:MAG: 50S ribosomal protein L19 [Candidatus Roizmanbacteria bacterium]|nr:50S ribosomal protein L19 [Candidatus Roizmanbacteria bacterium]
MANSFDFNKTMLKVGDTISLEYKIRDGEKERTQLFKGILLMIKGSTPETRNITVRKISKIGIGVERIIPLSSPNIVSLTVDKHSNFSKSKLFFIRDYTEAETRNKLYSIKKTRKLKKPAAKTV